MRITVCYCSDMKRLKIRAYESDVRYPDFFSKGAAVCTEVDPEAYFPEPGLIGSYEVQTAIRLCQDCVYKNECLEWALKNDEHGIWGGTTRHQRDKLMNRRSRNWVPVHKRPT
jgi:WhiB family redox-sensing transcriptional regulator